MANGPNTFATANAANGITVTATNIVLNGTAASNYALSSTQATATADITPATVTASVTAANKPYDGGNAANITTCTLSGNPANVGCVANGPNTFATVDAANGITVTATNIVLNGTAAGNYSLSSTQATTTANITPIGQTITVTTAAPASAGYNGQFTVAATASSGLAVSYSSGGGCCTNSGATFTMNSSTLACTVLFDQQGNSNYNAATEVTALVTATKANQTITVTTLPPASAAYKGQFTVAATASSGVAVSYSSSGGCSNSGATFTMISAFTACTVKFDQAGNSNYNPATQVTALVTAVGAAGVDLTEVVNVLTASPYSGGALQVSDTVLNQGTGSAVATTTFFYLSIDGKAKTTYLGYRSVPALGGTGINGPVTTTFTLPTNLNGPYYVIACADYYNAVAEIDESNNCVASGQFSIAGADLTESLVNVVTSNPVSGGAFQVSDTVWNKGAGNAGATYTYFYLSTNGIAQSTYLGYRSVTALSAGASNGPATTNLTLPANISGRTYQLLACSDYYNSVAESDETNNCVASSAFTVH